MTDLAYTLNGRGKQPFSPYPFVILIHYLYLLPKRQIQQLHIVRNYLIPWQHTYIPEEKCFAFKNFNYPPKSLKVLVNVSDKTAHISLRQFGSVGRASTSLSFWKIGSLSMSLLLDY